MKRLLPIYLLIAVWFISLTQGTAQVSGVYTELIGQYHTGLFDEGAAEIVAFDATAIWCHSFKGTATFDVSAPPVVSKTIFASDVPQVFKNSA